MNKEQKRGKTQKGDREIRTRQGGSFRCCNKFLYYLISSIVLVNLSGDITKWT